MQLFVDGILIYKYYFVLPVQCVVSYATWKQTLRYRILCSMFTGCICDAV